MLPVSLVSNGIVRFCRLVPLMLLLCGLLAGCDNAGDLVDGLKDQVADVTGSEKPSQPAVGTDTAASPDTTVEPSLPPVAAQPELPSPESLISELRNTQPQEFSDGFLKRLASVPEAAAQVAALEMTGSPITRDGLVALQKLPNLQSLAIDRVQTPADQLTVVGSLQTLTSLDLTNTPADDAVVQAVAKIPHLRSLTIDGLRITPAGFAALSGLHELQELSAHSANVNDAGLAAISGLPLRRLIVSATQVSNAGMPEIGKIETLEELNISQTLVTGAGMAGFRNLNLKKLTATQIIVGLDGLLAIKGMKSMEELNLFSASIPPVPQANIFKGLTSLRVLNLGRNNFNDAAVAALIAGHRSLEELVIAETPLTDASLQALIKNRDLKMLALQATKCTPAGAQAFKQKVPECKVFLDQGTF